MTLYASASIPSWAVSHDSEDDLRRSACDVGLNDRQELQMSPRNPA